MQVNVVAGLHSPVSEKEIVTAVKAAFRLAVRKSARAEVLFVGEARMRALNRQYRHKDRVTNILAFGGRKGGRPERVPPFLAPAAKDYVGEIVICIPQVRREARKLRTSVRQRVLILLVHGALHLLGFDHHRPHDEKKMIRLEQKICSKIFSKASDLPAADF